MAANFQPIYSRVADIQWIFIPAAGSALTAGDLTTGTVGTNVFLVMTADATNGGFVRELRIKVNPFGAGATAATVVRFWVNNGSTIATVTNSSLIGELGMAAVTNTQTAPTADFSYTVNFPLPPGYIIYATVGTAPGGNGLNVTAIAGKY
jgi:hypothetical protein